MIRLSKLSMGGVCLLLLPCLALAAERSGKAPAARKPPVRKAAPTKPAAAPAAAGAVIVKDWESGPNAVRAAQPGDLPQAGGGTISAARTAPLVSRTLDGSLDYTGPTLITTMTASKAADGAVSYECSQGGDHSRHKHPVTARTQGEAKE